MRLFRSLLPDFYVQKKYTDIGKAVGELVSYLFTDESIGFEKLLKEWEKLEGEYASRGFRTISLDRFVEFGGFEKSIKDVIGKKRKKKEEPIYHAKNYKEKYPKKVDTPFYDLETPSI